jgi:beta-lactamase regulating signal transducer with metallopeptidase domain
MQAVAIEAFERLIASFIWPALLHSLWIGLLAAAVAALVLQTCTRLSHHARYGILLAALFLTVLGPGVSMLLQCTIASRSTGGLEHASVFTSAVDPGAPSREQHTKPRAPYISYRAPNPSVDSYVAFFVRALANLADSLRQIRHFVVTAWLVGVVIGGAYIGLGTRAAHRLRSESDQVPEPIRARARALARRLRVKKSPAVLVHPRIDEPCLTGLFRPAILLPARWLASTHADLLDAILAHELAHERRLDLLVNLGQRLMESLLFFHPAVHWLSRSLRRQREFCTDRLAVRVTRNPLAMAIALESVARLRLSSKAPRLAGTALGGETTSLLSRIQELIGMKPSRPRGQFWPFFAIPVAGLIAVIAATAGLAQDRAQHSSIQTISEPAPETPQERASPTMVKRTLSDHESERQISYEVRIITLAAEPWRDLLKDRIKVVKQDADTCAWIIDDEALKDLLNLAQADTRSSVMRAPKVTTFENSSATIFREEKQHFVAQLEKIVRSDGAAFQPIVTAIEVGARMELIGAIQPGLTKLTVDLRDRQLVAMHTLHRKDRVGDKILAAEYQVPSTIYRQCRVACDMPDGSELLISMGLRERRTAPSNVGSGLLKLVGLAPASDSSVASELLFVIKPRPIALEAEERPRRQERLR